VLFRPRALAGPAIELAEPEVAVGHEWSHPQLLGQGQRLPVLAFGLVEIGTIPTGRDLAAQAQGQA